MDHFPESHPPPSVTDTQAPLTADLVHRMDAYWRAANYLPAGSYSETYPDVSPDEAGMERLFTPFSVPGGISSHVAPTTPGSIHGELVPRGDRRMGASPPTNSGALLRDMHGQDMPGIRNWTWTP